MSDKDKDAESIDVTVTASASGFPPQTATVTINDNKVVTAGGNANSFSGFRVEIVTPAEEWLGIDDMVMVRVIRRQGPSFQWGNYTSIMVGLFDEGVAHTMGERNEDARAFYCHDNFPGRQQSTQ